MYKGVNVYLGVIVSQGPAVGLLLYRFEYSLVRVCVCMRMCVYTCMYICVCIYMYLFNYLFIFCEFWIKA